MKLNFRADTCSQTQLLLLPITWTKWHSVEVWPPSCRATHARAAENACIASPPTNLQDCDRWLFESWNGKITRSRWYANNNFTVERHLNKKTSDLRYDEGGYVAELCKFWEACAAAWDFSTVGIPLRSNKTSNLINLWFTKLTEENISGLKVAQGFVGTALYE